MTNVTGNAKRQFKSKLILYYTNTNFWKRISRHSSISKKVYGTCAGVVNGLDSKSNGFQPREFESRQVRYFFANLRHEGRLSTYMHLHARDFFLFSQTTTCGAFEILFC